LVNGYTKWKFGNKDEPANILGVLAAYIIPGQKKYLNRLYRHLPKLPAGGGNLLDIGCGDGSFLELARNCGLNVTGIDFDPEAVANASKNGLTVYQGGIEIYEGKSELFDVIALNHVIEHVHDPIYVLKLCHRLLKSGGQIWIETPNINSYGHKRFQDNWRGLESPRHLVIFNEQSLRNSLNVAGFKSSQLRNSNNVTVGMYQVSFSMENGISPYRPLPLSKSLYLEALIVKLKEIIMNRSEFIAISANKES
jgi:2-polyprenyl-3-methyl-5-hydroxy-6-metoxy-1,4-benzoquinol methylase